MCLVSGLEDKKTSEFEVLDHRVLSDDLCIEHLEKASGYFFPVGDCTDVVKHGAALSEAHSLLHLLNEFDASKVHVVSFLAQSAFFVDALRDVLLGATELTGPKEEGQMLVVVETPDSV